jgi:1-acyl-sn-glycerol-3-phosphate acyltransferase
MNEENRNRHINDGSDERVFYMWEPLQFSVEKGYDYLGDGPVKRTAAFVLHTVAVIILTAYNRLAFGYKITGRKNLRLVKGRGAVTVCNHVHPMDCTMIDMALLGHRVYYPTIAANFKIPVIRHVIRTLGAVPIAGGSRLAELFGAMDTAIKRGDYVQLYPESVMRPYKQGLGRFQDGAFYLAVRACAPVVPMVLTYHRPRGLYRLYKKKPCIHVNILPPVEPPCEGTRREKINRLRDTCEQIMRDAIEQIGEADAFDIGRSAKKGG